LAQQKYIQAKGLEVLVKSGSDQEQAARDLLTEAKEFLEKNNHLAALRLTEQGQNFVQHIRNVYDIILAFGARLDQDCKRFEIKFAEMRQIRKDAQTKVQQCKGNTASISDLIAPVIEEQGPLDYISLMADLIRQEHNRNECVKRFQKASDPLCGGNLSR
jgi:diacylglycerol kinase family enzyme